MSGRKGQAPCGHDGEHIVGSYVRCARGCDAVARTPERSTSKSIEFSTTVRTLSVDLVTNGAIVPTPQYTTKPVLWPTAGNVSAPPKLAIGATYLVDLSAQPAPGDHVTVDGSYREVAAGTVGAYDCIVLTLVTRALTATNCFVYRCEVQVLSEITAAPSPAPTYAVMKLSPRTQCNINTNLSPLTFMSLYGSVGDIVITDGASFWAAGGVLQATSPPAGAAYAVVFALTSVSNGGTIVQVTTTGTYV